MSFSDFDRPLASPGGDGGLASGLNTEEAGELQEFLALEQQRAQLRSQIQTITDVCWDKCVDKPSSKLDGRTEGCLENCVARFVDVSLLIANRFSQAVQRKGGV